MAKAADRCQMNLFSKINSALFASLSLTFYGHTLPLRSELQQYPQLYYGMDAIILQLAVITACCYRRI